LVKREKNFSKGYLQNGFYMINYEKFKMGHLVCAEKRGKAFENVDSAQSKPPIGQEK